MQGHRRALRAHWFYQRGFSRTARSTGTIYVTDAADNSVRVLTIVPGSAQPVPATVTVSGNVTLSGRAPIPPALTPDGSRAVTLTSSSNWLTGAMTTQATVFDTATGRQVGTPVTISGAPRYYEYQTSVSADGTRVVITTTATNQQTGATTGVTLIDTATGRQVGKTVTLAGNQASATVTNAAGTRALITTTSDDLATTRFAVVDTTTGAQLGTTVSLAGAPTIYPTMSPVLNAAGTRALVITSGRIAVIDTATGLQIGNTLTVTGGPPAVTVVGASVLIETTPYRTQIAVVNANTGAQTLTLTADLPQDTMTLNPSGTRAVITHGITGSQATQVSVIDTVSGAPIGTTVSLAGPPRGSTLFNAAGTRALVTMDVYDEATGSHSTQVSVIDTANGTHVGSTLIVDGSLLGSTVFGASGGRALITSSGDGPTGSSTLVSVVDTTSGAQIGTTGIISGTQTGPISVNAAGTRAVITAAGVAVIDTATGGQIGTTLSVGAQGVSTQLSADGTRAVITVFGNTTQVAVIDTGTGNQVGATVSVVGMQAESTKLAANDTRAVVATIRYDAATDIFTGAAAVIDTSTGAQVGTTSQIASELVMWPTFSTDGSRVMLVSHTADWLTGVTAHVMVIDAVTGTKVTTNVAGQEAVNR